MACALFEAPIFWITLFRWNTAVRSEMEQEYSKRLADARKQIRVEQDEADAARICAVRETMGVRMGEYRRGKVSHLLGIGAAAVVSFGVGYAAQRSADVRIKGVPALAIAGLPGVALGVAFDESLAFRASLVVGGAMFTVGTAAYALAHPEPPAPAIAPAPPIDGAIV